MAGESKKPKLLSAGHPDHFQTPPEALDCLVGYVPTTWRVWEPAAGKRRLVGALRERGYQVIDTDIIDDPPVDFLHANPPEGIDCIITNPPFSIKQKVLSRCYQLGIPFALLLPITTFDSQRRRELFHRHGVQVVLPNGRISFETPNGAGSSSWFYTAWFTAGLNLPAQLIFHGMEVTLL